ncbi:RCC1 domain-containing protein [Corallococcus sp. CA053C]|uniref:RCC1 domain-containing protein n=1 Tax=Corallococcus sp. CA053C TaxID=2316732 RepID=UPI001F2F7240|nr:RCC1 domain-containing protein [Corallococcus sp. CA053C]
MLPASIRLPLALALALLASCSAPPAGTDATAVPTSSGETVAQALTATRVTPLHSERSGIGLQLHDSSTRTLDALVAVDARRSLVVTEQAIVSTFTLKAVMDQLVAQSGVPGLTSLQLFRQLWDTQNPKPGLGLGAHCNDQVDTGGNPAFNGYPYACRAPEGAQAQTDPFTDPNSGNAYMAVGLFNRFDLAPVNGAECGEYRIVFAKRSGATSGTNRNFLIFEAALPNPNPTLGLEGCLPVAKFWQGLTNNSDLASRAAALRTFYFQGLPGFRPVVHIDNYGADVNRGTGQIRTNMFMQPTWLLREFKLQKTCDTSGCSALKAVIVTDKVNPFGGLFSPTSTHPLAADFRAFLPGQVAMLATPDINLFNYEVPERFNGGQSLAQGSENNYSVQFGAGGTLRSALQTELTRIGSPLTPDQLVQRAKALSCAGCHELSNGANVGTPQTWPRSLGFTHTSEITETGPEGVRFRLSPAVLDVFLPHRKAVLEEFLNRPRPCLNGCVAAGYSHSLVVRPDGTVWAAGNNSGGRLGNGSTVNSTTPVQVSGVSGIVAVSTAYSHSLALRSDGTVWAWGDNTSGQLGDGTTVQRLTAVQVSGLSGVVAVAAGGSFSVALRDDGTLRTWGNNSHGQLGDGSTTNRLLPGPVSNLGGVTSISAGGSHVLALRSDGVLWSWGGNDSGQQGDGTSSDRLTPLQVSGVTNVKSVDAGNEHSLVARSDGTVWIWGYIITSQQNGGWGGYFSRSPTQVVGLTGIVAVSAGWYHSLALRSDNTLWAWGKNLGGQLGTGNRQVAITPQQVSGPGGIVSMSAGGEHSLAVRADGTLWAWGDNEYGQRGDGTTGAQTRAAQVPGLSALVAVAAGGNHALAQHSDGTVWAWGDNSHGQLGLGDVITRASPTQVAGLGNVGSVSAGGGHSLALLYDGTVWAWGDNASGQLGLGSTSPRTTPTQVPGLDGIVAVAAAGSHTVAVRYDGTVWSWGDNWYGQLGIGSTTGRTVPTQVLGLSGIVAVAAGLRYSLALHYDGTVWAWGDNASGQLGDGTTLQRTTPVRLLGLSNVVALDAGNTHTLAVRSDGTLWAWGSNSNGELGSAASANRTTPAQLPGLSGVVTVAAGNTHSMVVNSSGWLFNWGRNTSGELGNGTTSFSSNATPAPAMMSVQAVASSSPDRWGETFALALRTDGTLWAWGSNTDGQLGPGKPTRYASVPVRSLLF